MTIQYCSTHKIEYEAASDEVASYFCPKCKAPKDNNHNNNKPKTILRKILNKEQDYASLFRPKITSDN